MEESIIVKIGGSLIYDKELALNKKFLHKIANWYDTVKHRKYVIFVVGGGKISRHITSQIKEISPENEGLHRIGMATTIVNAEILGSILDGDAFVPRTFGDAFDFILSGKGGTMITGGYKVGWSTDMDAAVFADILGEKTFYKLSNIDKVYTDDPALVHDAQPISEISWMEYMKQFGIKPGMTQHEPGLNTPVGAYCAQFCSRKGLTVKLGGGENLEKEIPIDEVFELGTKLHP